MWCTIYVVKYHTNGMERQTTRLLATLGVPAPPPAHCTVVTYPKRSGGSAMQRHAAMILPLTAEF